MKRLAVVAFVFAVLVFWALTHPQQVSVVYCLVAIILLQLALIISLVAWPITEYITVDKWHEKWREVKDPSWRGIINDARGVEGLSFRLKTGSSITGKLVARDDSKNTFGILTEGRVEVIIQDTLERIGTSQALLESNASLFSKIKKQAQAWNEETAA